MLNLTTTTVDTRIKEAEEAVQHAKKLLDLAKENAYSAYLDMREPDWDFEKQPEYEAACKVKEAAKEQLEEAEEKLSNLEWEKEDQKIQEEERDVKRAAARYSKFIDLAIKGFALYGFYHFITRFM